MLQELMAPKSGGAVMTTQTANGASVSSHLRVEDVPVIIMAGGKGTRLGHLTREVPKPLVHVAGRPVLDHILDHLTQNSVDTATITLCHLPEAIPKYLRDGSERGFRVQYSPTLDDWGSAGGALRAGRRTAGDPLLIMSGDVITNFDLNQLLAFHQRKNSPFTMALARVEDASEYGVAETDGQGRIERFVEKPRFCPTGGCMINSGIYVVNREILERIPDDKPCDFGREFIPGLVRDGVPVYGCGMDGYWFDIGTVASLKRAEDYLCQVNHSTPLGSFPKHSHNGKPRPPSIWV